MKLYLSTEGSYSYYRVVGVFSNPELAEQCNKLHASTNSIEEFELDKVLEHPPGMFFYGVMMSREGNVDQVAQISPEEKEQASPIYLKGYWFTTWATDDKHAVKIANEKRLQLLATNRWRDYEKL